MKVLNMKRMLLIALLFCRLLLPEVVAQTGQPTKVKILDISVEGNVRANAGMIRGNSNLRAGQEIDITDIQKAIRHLWASGLYSDIQILVDKELASGIYVVIKVKERSRLDKIVIDGNDKVKKEDIQKELEKERL